MTSRQAADIELAKALQCYSCSWLTPCSRLRSGWQASSRHWAHRSLHSRCQRYHNASHAPHQRLRAVQTCISRAVSSSHGGEGVGRARQLARNGIRARQSVRSGSSCSGTAGVTASIGGSRAWPCWAMAVAEMGRAADLRRQHTGGGQLEAFNSAQPRSARSSGTFKLALRNVAVSGGAGFCAARRLLIGTFRSQLRPSCDGHVGSTRRASSGNRWRASRTTLIGRQLASGMCAPVHLLLSRPQLAS